MGILDSMKGLISRRKKLADIDMRDLETARARLEREQDRVLGKINEIEKQKAVLDAQGRAERSVRKQQLLAEKMLQLENEAKHHSRTLAIFSKQLRVVNGFVFLKEQSRTLSSTPLGEILSKMDTFELQEYIDQASIDGSLQIERLNQVLGIFAEGEALLKEDEGDKVRDSIVARWQQEQESEATLPELGEEEGGPWEAQRER